MKKTSGPSHSLPPEVLADISAEELDALEATWRLFGGMPENHALEARIPALAGEMRTFLHSAGALPETAAAKRGMRLVPLRRVRIFPLRRWQGYTAIAACVLILMSIGITLENNTIEAPYGEQRTHTLEDGSTLLLNSGTKVRIAADYNKDSRELDLMRGEVLFDVTASPLPFAVKTDHGVIDVLGTSFNIRSWPSDAASATDVAVKSGTVRLTARSGEQAILEAGDTARLVKGEPVRVSEASREAENQLSWPEGFKFSNHPTQDILEELERRYDVNIDVDVQGLEKTRSGILLESPEGPEQILHDLCELHRCTYQASPDGRTFRIAPLQ